MARSFVPRRIVLALILLTITVVGGTLGYILVEGWTVLDALYMTVITLTTVGFGEVRPLTQAGRLFTISLLLSGFGILTYGITAGLSFLLEGELGTVLRRRKMEKQIREMKHHYIICVTGDTGEYVIDEFIRTRRAAVVVTPDRPLADELGERGVPCIVDNPTEDAVLREAGIERASGIVTVLEDDRDNLFAVLTARGLNPRIKIVTQAIDKSTAAKMKKAGADEVILTEAIGGMRIASAMLRPEVVLFMDTMLRETGETLRIEEAKVSEDSVVMDKTLAESQISSRTGMIIIAIKNSQTGKYLYNPGPNYVLRPGDVLIVIGNPEQLGRLNGIVA